MSALRSDEAWQVKAACRGPQSELFYPPKDFERKEDKLDRESRAKSICARCSSKKSCLEYAVSIKELHGIWGGLNENERRALMAARGIL